VTQIDGAGIDRDRVKSGWGLTRSNFVCTQFGNMIRKHMRIIARRTLLDYAASRHGHKDHPALTSALNSWFSETQSAKWTNAAAIRLHFATASFVGADRVVFNIKGNSYRLIVAMDYAHAIVWIKWIGTHAEYDKNDAKTVQFGA
jgi:mRNA interferase HigB